MFNCTSEENEHELEQIWIRYWNVKVVIVVHLIGGNNHSRAYPLDVSAGPSGPGSPVNPPYCAYSVWDCIVTCGGPFYILAWRHSLWRVLFDVIIVIILSFAHSPSYCVVAFRLCILSSLYFSFRRSYIFHCVFDELGCPNNFSILVLPRPTSFRNFFLSSLYFRHSGKYCSTVSLPCPHS